VNGRLGLGLQVNVQNKESSVPIQGTYTIAGDTVAVTRAMHKGLPSADATYDIKSRKPLKVKRPDGAEITYAYDKAFRLSRATMQKGGVATTFNLTYDTRGNIAGIMDSRRPALED
jgi:YD repeat-containing protein